MNALKYLAVDHCLDSNKEVVGRFRSGADGVIPVFNDSGNAEASPVRVDDVSDRQAESRSSRSMWRMFFGWLAPVRSQAPGASSEGTATQPELAEAAPVCSGRVDPADDTDDEGRTAVTRRRLGLLPRSNPFTRKERTPIQAEFRFENVRVVCNELHDTDFVIKT